MNLVLPQPVGPLSKSGRQWALAARPISISFDLGRKKGSVITRCSSSRHSIGTFIIVLIIKYMIYADNI
jgi:hypothetical protein